MASSAPVADALQADAQEVGFKVFVGNLAFSTKDVDLKQAFGKFGEISEALVINRGTRSLGYGFVTFAKEADATASVSKMDKSELSGRQINVEFAKPPSSTPAGRAPREAAAAAAAAPTAAATGAADGEVKAKKPRNRRPKSRKPRKDGETEEAGDAPVDGSAEASQAPAQNGGDSAAAASGGEARPPRKPRAPAAKRTPPTGPPSPTLLFVSNLPFSATDDSLKQAFADKGLKVVSARVVIRKFGAGKGRSKGFGFVDFESTEAQQAALTQMHGAEIDGRQISLKVALEHDNKEEDSTGLASGEVVAS